ncbi:hypothetical protein BJY04DRAFT_203819 [Aspergillus karnatakaensis]|uniref:fungal specific transcription factor domain-containing protein n=1 Tax=Aspergillus karnatakaensis TaxID=1810916 RepID=UPI003CCD8B83
MEAEQFATSLEQGQFECLRNHSWLAVYLSLLVAGLIFMDDAELFAQLSVTFSSRDDVGKLWYRTVLRQMELSDFIGRPSLHVVQAIAILNLCSRHLGERQRELTLTAIAISTAKSLKMHMLGNELSCPARIRKMAQWSTQPNRELGRRLWWSLVICDWLGAASRSPSIQVDHFDTELSDGAYDVVHLLGPTAIHQPFTSLPPISHHLAMARLASIARTHFEANSRSLKNLKDTLAKVQQLENQSPFVTPLTFEPSTVLPIWAIGQRYHFFFTLNLLRLRLCRVLFQTNVEILDEGYEALRQCALSAAIAISDNTEFPYIYKKTWIFASATIAAGVFLALDTLKHRRTQSSVRTEQQKQRIMSCISTITPYATITTISRGGSIVLGQLLNKLEQAESGIQSVDIMQSILKMGCGSVPSGQTPGQDESAGSVTGFQGQSNPQLPNELLDNELPIIDWNIFEDWSLLSGDVLF